MLLPSHDQQVQLDELDAAIATQAGGARRRDRRAAAAATWEQTRVGETGAADDRRVNGDRADRALRARRQFLGHLRAISARPHDRRRSDVRRRAGRPRRFVRRRHRGQLRQRRRFDRGDRVQPGGLAEGPGQPADHRLPEARRPAASPRLRVAPRRHRARRHPEVGRATDGHAWRPTRRRVRIQVRTRERLTLGDWYHVALTYDGSGKAAGLALYRERRARGHRGRAGCADRIDRDATRRCASGSQALGAAVRRADRRPAALQPRADAGRNRATSRSTTPCASFSPA